MIDSFNLKYFYARLFLLVISSQVVYPQLSNQNELYDPLPVELVYFYPVVQLNGVLLKWGTATEVSNFGFEVQRGVGSYNFEMIGFVEGNGNSNSPKDYEFLDSLVEQSGLVYYRLKQIDFNGTAEYSDTVKVDFVTSIEESDNFAETGFFLEEAFPNPFNSSVMISYQLFNGSYISLKVYDILGGEVASLFNEFQYAGKYKIKFNFDQNYSHKASGIFFVQLRSGNLGSTKKIVYLK